MSQNLSLPIHPLTSSNATWRVPPASGILDHNAFPHTDPQAILKLQAVTLQTFNRAKLPVQIIETIPGPWFCQLTVEALPGSSQGFLGRFRAQKFDIQKTILEQTRFYLAQIDIPIPRRPRLYILAVNPDLPPIPLRPVLTSPVYQQATGRLNIPLGVDLAGQPVVADLAAFPHLLVGGTTGAGKSVFVNSILAGLLCRYSPNELRLLLCDGNMIELFPYRAIPHMIGEVATKPNEIYPLMSWVEAEISRRLEYMGVGSPHWPSLVVVIEHLSSFTPAKSRLSGVLERILPLAPQAGVHFIFTDSYPDAKILPAAVKRQIPARACFAVPQIQASQTVLNRPDALNLIRPGDFWFQAGAEQPLQRVQACMLSRREFLRLLHFWKDQAHS